MKYLVACSIFITDEVNGCAPVYLDICVYILIAAGLAGGFMMMKKIIKYLSSYRG